MNPLNDLIERLCREQFTPERQQPQAAAPSLDTLPISQSDHITRLRQVLSEMSDLLCLEDQPQLPLDPPSPTAIRRILNHWESMLHSIEGYRLHMQSLEQDIVRMQPWGNFDVMKVEQLRRSGCYLRFWTQPLTAYLQQHTDEWYILHQALLVTQDATTAYFVTIDPSPEAVASPSSTAADHIRRDTVASSPALTEIDLCPCPVSTLIMLQTRDKDSLKKMETLMGDYALVHYGEVYTALQQALPPGTPLPQLKPERHGLRYRLHHLFRK